MLSRWILGLLIFLLLLGFVLAIGWWYRNRYVPRPQPPSPYDSPIAWGPPSKGPNPNKNVCQVYQFPTVVNSGKVYMGAPTLDPEVLDRLNGSTDLPFCIDPDQILAQQLIRTCIQRQQVESDINLCYRTDGSLVPLGTKEVYYASKSNVSQGCPNISSCAGQLSFVALSYQVPTNTQLACLTTQGTVELCDPTTGNQLFRLTRVEIGQDPSTLKPGQGQNGPLTQILDRASGLCLTKGDGSATTTYNPQWVGCQGGQSQYTGTNLVLGTCTKGPYPGYEWLLLPSLTYCPDRSGCTGGVGALYTPQQIVYVGDLDFTTFPTGGTYDGYTGSTAIIQWLIDNKAQSIYYGGQGSTAILGPLGTDYTKCQEKGYIAQYLNFSLYNTIKTQSACYASGTLGTPVCTGF